MDDALGQRKKLYSLYNAASSRGYSEKYSENTASVNSRGLGLKCVQVLQTVKHCTYTHNEK